ncbi:MAG: type II secretion system F family protein [Anaerolineae bacterium]
MAQGIPLIVAGLAALAVVLIFMALWLLLQQRDPIDERLEEYGLKPEDAAGRYPVGDPRARYYQSRLKRFLAGFGLGPQLALSLARADSPLTVAEFTLIVIGLAVLGFVVGTVRYNALLGGALALVLAVTPVLILRIRQRRRVRAFTEQLPDMLTLLVGALRAGYGLNQALELLVERMSPPMSTEMNNVSRAINLGIPMQRALEDAVYRIGSDDFNLVVVAINVQYETGGNLAETLEIISETVRDRLRMLSEIRVLTAQQRFTGYVLAVLPIAVGLLIFFINPEYMGELFEPGWVRILPALALGLQVMGFLFIRRIVDIEV